MPYGLLEIKAGFIGAAASSKGLTRLTLPCQSEVAALGWVEKCGPRDDLAFTELFSLLRRYFDGSPVDFSAIALDLTGLTAFRRSVYGRLRRLPRGQTTTYGELARDIGSPAAARAVGAAMAANPLCIVVPCHRVIGANGQLTGFGGGLPLKRRMLALEAS